jgi:hypothetical protein
VKPLSEQTLYEILEIPFDAPESEIVRAWERVEALYGPGSLATYTLISPDEAKLLGQRLEEALTVLLDPVARKQYDSRISGTPVPRPGRAEDVSGPARPPERLPPVIPPLFARAAADVAPVAASLKQLPAPPVETVPTVEATEPSAPPPLAPLPTPTILLSAVVAPPSRPIPLETPTPVSPPFAAVVEPVTLPVRPPPPAPAPAHSARPQPDKGLFVPEGTRFSGEVIRRAREARGLTVQQMCERTKITRYHIENLEAERFEKLPVPVYLRGILMAIAKELRLDGQKVARSYIEGMAPAPEVQPKPR